MDRTSLDIATDKQLLEVFRYLTAPPVSKDGLSVVAEAPSFTRKQLTENPEQLRRQVEVVRTILDKRRFPRLDENRMPTESERESAILASACLLAAGRVETNRRSTVKNRQRAVVGEVLRPIGLQVAPARGIPNISYAPGVGEFCGESVLGSGKSYQSRS